MAECHPVGFQWVVEAKARGAKVIHVDPRFTRTSALADLHVPIRAGSDIAFLGGIVNHILENGREFREYVVNYTNAPVIVDEAFADTEDLDGLFSGFDPETGTYDPAQLAVRRHGGGQQRRLPPAPDRRRGGPRLGRGQAVPRQPAPHRPHPGASPLRVPAPQAALPRYTPELVEQVCGVPREQFLEVAEALCANSGRERTSAFCYAVGWTHHANGVQFIRTAAIVQLLLGNMGRPGGGIMALRGHASIQGSTDIPTLYNLLPGYLPMPIAGVHGSLARVPGRHPPAGRVLGPLRQLHGQPAQGLVRRPRAPPATTSASTTCPS